MEEQWFTNKLFIQTDVSNSCKIINLYIYIYIYIYKVADICVCMKNFVLKVCVALREWKCFQHKN